MALPSDFPMKEPLLLKPDNQNFSNFYSIVHNPLTIYNSRLLRA